MKHQKFIELIKLNCGNNVVILIDLDNVYYTFRNYGIDIIGCENNLIDKLYELYQKDPIRCIRAYADFQQIEINLNTLQQKRVEIKHVFGNGKGESHRKNASDIELSLDALELCYLNEKLDTFVFVTSDSDMIPVMSRLIYHNKNVHLFYVREHTSQHQNITDFANVSVDMVELFNINLDTSKPEYWKRSAIDIIIDFYKRKPNMIYGGKWLKDDLTKTLTISSSLASEIIEYLEKENVIRYTTKVHEDKEHNGYILCEATDLSEAAITSE